jgi:Zn-dependent peptidase ImmA (M78 family)
MMSRATEELKLVFGEDSQGSSEEERALSSCNQFVRSRVQLAPMSQGATGHVFTAVEALRIFGWNALWKAASEGSHLLLDSPYEPAASFRKRREELGLTIEDLHKRLDVQKDVVEHAETPGVDSPIRILERIAQTLGLDERKLGVSGNLSDQRLGVRLRELLHTTKAKFSQSMVMKLSEAAWVISRQVDLQKQLPNEAARHQLPNSDDNFGPKAYAAGYRLARQTRQMIGLGEFEPIESVRDIIEIEFGLPLIQMQMPKHFAGATIDNQGRRGIVINDAGMNENVWTRRLTMCHELGHLLWDSEDRLEKIKVDEYRELQSSDRSVSHDEVESRANAFAVEFLAPSAAVQDISEKNQDIRTTVFEVAEHFAISLAAAKHHVKNVTGIDTSSVNLRGSPKPNDDLKGRENLGIDYYPINEAEISRRGRFSLYVAKLALRGEISLDSAAMHLGVDHDLVSLERMKAVENLLDGSASIV